MVKTFDDYAMQVANAQTALARAQAAMADARVAQLAAEQDLDRANQAMRQFTDDQVKQHRG